MRIDLRELCAILLITLVIGGGVFQIFRSDSATTARSAIAALTKDSRHHITPVSDLVETLSFRNNPNLQD